MAADFSRGLKSTVVSEMDGRDVEGGVVNVCSEHEIEDENCEDTETEREELGQLSQSQYIALMFQMDLYHEVR
jgi:hypothetical protein